MVLCYVLLKKKSNENEAFFVLYIDGVPAKTETLIGVDENGNLFYDVFLDGKRGRQNSGPEPKSGVASTASDINITISEEKGKKPYYQDEETHRWSYVPEERIITLIKKANPATIVHEMGHHFTMPYIRLLQENGQTARRGIFLNQQERKNVMKICTAVLLAFLAMAGNAAAGEAKTVSGESLPPVQRVEEGRRFRPHHRRMPHHGEAYSFQGSAAGEDFPAAVDDNEMPLPPHDRRRLPRPAPEAPLPAADAREQPPVPPYHHMYGNGASRRVEPVAVLTDSN